MRGEIVDFDLLQIKEMMKNSPKPIEVKAREDFIEKKLRRRVKRIVRADSPFAPPVDNSADEPATPE